MPRSEKQHLHHLARLYGVQVEYYNGYGRLSQPSVDGLLSILRGRGAVVEKMQDVPDAVRARRQALWQQPIAPVIVQWEKTPPRFSLRLPASAAVDSVPYEVQLESGEIKAGICRSEASNKSETHVEGVLYAKQALSLPDQLPFGYHQLTLKLPATPVTSLLISAPEQAFTSADGDKEKKWGVFIPLYALYSQRSWGAGDFLDLQELVRRTEELGGDMIGTLPLLPAFLDDPYEYSPYSPVSRLLWNEFYINVQDLPELDQCRGARELLNSPAFQQEITNLRQQNLVDYRRQMGLKRKILEELARWFFSQEPQRTRAFWNFVETHRRVEDYAEFRATDETTQKRWRLWPEANRDGVLKSGDFLEEKKLYYLYAQWLAHEQVAGLSRKTKGSATRLYLDMPLGVHPDGYDVWRERSAFALDISGGAPPDPFFTRGQDWGFPPLHPEGLRSAQYRYFIDCIRHHLAHAGVLRLDHVMSLHRLFWVPNGLQPTDGTYVRYPAAELYAILTLESQRHSALIVGENLGTVPPVVNESMQKHGVYGMYVTRFEIHPDATMRPIPPRMVASLNTHDMATFAGFWKGKEIEQKRALNLIDDQKAEEERQDVEKLRGALVQFLRNSGASLQDDPQMEDVLKALLLHLAASPADVLLITLEDLWLEIEPQNVPGTWQERSNWRRKARYSLEQCCQDPALVATLKEINNARKRGV